MNQANNHQNNISCSPPKKYKSRMEEIMGSNSKRAALSNSIKKKLQIEQENYNSLNNENIQDNRILIEEKPAFRRPFGELEMKKEMLIESAPFHSISSNLANLSSDLLMLIFQYLTPEEIVSKMQYVCKSLHNVATHTRFWTYLNRISKLAINDKYLKQQCLVERRSKGKLFKAVSRVNMERVSIFLA